MQKVIDFCLQNYRLILDLVSIFIVIIFFLAKKKPVNSILESIYQCALLAILETEQITTLKGKDKLEYAVNLVNKWLTSRYPKLDFNRYHYLIVNTIEIILSTPQKKGENDGK